MKWWRWDWLMNVSGWYERRERLILKLLAAAEKRRDQLVCEMYGLELVKASGGRLSRSTVYVYLASMEDEGLITSRYEDEPSPYADGARRRVYRLTSIGRARAL